MQENSDKSKTQKTAYIVSLILVILEIVFAFVYYRYLFIWLSIDKILATKDYFAMALPCVIVVINLVCAICKKTGKALSIINYLSILIQPLNKEFIKLMMYLVVFLFGQY